MQAYKVKGTIDETGHLVITEPIELHPGEVEVILLQSSTGQVTASSSEKMMDEESVTDAEDVIPGLRQWLEQSPPVSPDYDPEQAKWEYLKEKHNL
jgi:molecular chaperone DnaK (HSP70)